MSTGTWLTAAGGIGRQRALRCIGAALDCGITFLETADVVQA